MGAWSPSTVVWSELPLNGRGALSGNNGMCSFGSSADSQRGRGLKQVRSTPTAGRCLEGLWACQRHICIDQERWVWPRMRGDTAWTRPSRSSSPSADGLFSEMCRASLVHTRFEYIYGLIDFKTRSHVAQGAFVD